MKIWCMGNGIEIISGRGRHSTHSHFPPAGAGRVSRRPRPTRRPESQLTPRQIALVDPLHGQNGGHLLTWRSPRSGACEKTIRAHCVGYQTEGRWEGSRIAWLPTDLSKFDDL